MGAKDVAECFEFAAQGQVVMYCAVEDHEDVAGLVGERLPPGVGQVEDGQAAAGEEEVRAGPGLWSVLNAGGPAAGVRTEVTRIIRPAVDEGVRHPLDGKGVGVVGGVHPPQPGNTTHVGTPASTIGQPAL